ncbi:MAG: NifB/NifX family molybdenum-iron cluster-binding protein [Myxococcota bacterium]
MKICIPTIDDAGFEGILAEHFGRAPFLTMVDVSNGKVRALHNPGCHSRAHECHHIPVLAAHDVQAVVCRRMGRRALASLNASGIDVFEVPMNASVGRVAALMKSGELPLSNPRDQCDEVHRGHGQRRNGACRDHHE